jgi:hypothetical protein
MADKFEKLDEQYREKAEAIVRDFNDDDIDYGIRLREDSGRYYVQALNHNGYVVTSICNTIVEALNVLYVMDAVRKVTKAHRS